MNFFSEDTKATVKRAANMDTWSVPFKWLWKIVVAVFIIAMAWFTMQGTVSDLKSDIAALNGQTQNLAKLNDEMRANIKALKNAEFCVLRELMATTGELYVIVADDMSLIELSDKLNVSPNIVLASNPSLMNFEKIQAGTIIKLPRMLSVNSGPSAPANTNPLEGLIGGPIAESRPAPAPDVPMVIQKKM